MSKGESTYTQYYSNFIGADMSSDPRVVARNRLAYSVNMWRDYESEQGAAIETFPGFRRVQAMRNGEDDYYDISGLWHYKGPRNEYVIFQKYATLYACKTTELEKEPTNLYTGISPNGATGYTINNNLYLTSPQSGRIYHAHLVVINEDLNGNITAKVVEEYYVPTTYYNGKPYEQRNALTNKVKQICTDGGMGDNYVYYYKNEYGEQSKGTSVTTFQMLEKVKVTVSSIVSVYVNDVEFKPVNEGEELANNNYVVKTDSEFLGISFLPEAVKNVDNTNKTIEVVYFADPIKFNTIGELKPFKKDNMPMAEAILGCTKSAVYDGRVFLTGNPELPNTVFYSQRNLTGANDPTYFGVYNYFNDGDGNTPNVELLAMPSMLMVIKGDTAQDGSVYYHVGVDNTHEDKSVRDLMPRLYPATKGAAGLGSVGTTEPYSLSCNFLDDPVFLSRRGLEGVSKEQLTAERTIGHRSSNIDRLLTKEDLAHASIAEWKGYLVICCNGHIYLADSRRLSQHPDGSYQYEWFYLEGVGTYSEYQDAYIKLTEWPLIDGVSLKDIVAKDTSCVYKLWDSEGLIWDGKAGYISSVQIDSTRVYYFLDYAESSRRIVDIAYGEKIGTGDFYGAKHVLCVGDMLVFATDHDICVFNTDKRGEHIYVKDGQGKRIIAREVDEDKIDSSYYSFNGVAYKSACATRLDDCDKKSLTKNTVYGTTAARFKMIPGSHCKIKASTNGRDFEEIGEAFSTRNDFSDTQFDKISFAENENDILILPELSRGWVDKQYYFESDGFCEPFGLYELSYIYKIAGKIRYF